MSLHGVGLSIVPGSRVDVNIAVAKWSVKRSWEKILMHTEKNLVPRTDIAPVYFKAPVTVSNTCKITVTVNGTGFAFVATRFTVKQLNKLAMIIDNVILPKMKINQKMPREVVYGPKEYRAIEYPYIGTVQSKRGVAFFVRKIQ